jgi:hypothetical protein
MLRCYRSLLWHPVEAHHTVNEDSRWHCRAAGTSSMSVLRTTRLMRVFKLARSWKELNRIITAVLRSFSQVCYLSLLLLLFVYIIALMGMQLFGHKFSSCDVEGAQQLCPPGMQRQECPSYPDCYVPCSESQAATWLSVPGECSCDIGIVMGIISYAGLPLQKQLAH